MKKNNFFNKLLIRKFIYFFVLYFGVSFSAFAEGTKQTTPYNATTGAEIQLQINRTATGGAASLFAGWTATSVNDRMYIRINDYTTEKVYLGFRKETSSQDVRFRIKRPDGTVVYGPTAIPTSGAGYIDTWAQANIGPSNLTGNTGGYQAIVFDPNVNANSRVNGDFYIEFNVGTSANTTQIFLRYYDITVANGTANTNVINGRLWSYNWGFNSGSFDSNGYFGSLYSYTTDSIVTEIDLNGIRPYYFRIHNNSTGPRNNLTLQENRKSVEGLYENPEYKLFLNEPDINVFPSKKNPVVNVVYNGISGCGNSYCINLSVDNSALAYIMLDINNDGDYIDAVDRILEQSVVGGVNCILWDGKDGLGADVVNGTQFKIEVSTQQGTTHLPIYDAENHPNGYLARLVRPLGIGTVYMYYDNSSLATKGGVTSSSNLFGTTPPTPLTGNTVNTNGINKWNTTSGSIYYGDERTINTWWSIRKSAYVGLTINKPYCADLSVTITDGVIQYVPNSTLTYTVVVSNAGPNAVPGATFTNNAPVGTTITSWTATGTSGTVYTASGSGNINQTLTIPVGGTITYTVTVSVPSTVTGNLVNTANISAPSDYSDPNLANNTASDTDVEKPIAENDINQTPQDTLLSGQLMTNDEGITSISGVTIGGSPFILGTPKTVSGIDRNGNPVTNAGSLVINANGTYTFTPATGFTGLINPVTYTGLGANGSSDTADLTIEVLPKLVPGNNPPVAQNDVNTTEMNTSISSSVLPNDSDPDGDVLSVISSSLSIGIPTQVSGVSNLGVNVPNAGTVTLNPNGTYTYLPTTGFIGTVNDITYTISDGNGGIDSAVLSINVVGNSGNNTFANDDANSAPQGTTMTGNVLTNDFDPEGNTQTVSTASATYNGSTTTITIDTSTEIPNVGSLTLNSNGTYTFVPLSTFVGTVPVIYNKCDNGTPQACDEATLYLTSIPKAVIAENDINQTPQDTPVSGQLMTNDEGVTSVTGATIGGSPFTLGTAKQVAGVDRNGNPVTNAGSLVINANGTYTFTPATGFVGTINPVTYTGAGTNGGTDTAILSIEVLPVLVPGNNPPVAQNDVNTTEVNVTISSGVLPNDSDPDGDVLTVTSVLTGVQVAGKDSYGNAVANAGTITLNANGTYTYVPATGFIGTVNDITYTISDGKGGTDSAILSISVIGNNGNNTFANDDANSAPQGTTMTGNILTNDFDPEGNTQTVTVAVADGTPLIIGSSTTITGVGSLTLNENGSYTFDPLASFTGTVEVPYTICDNGIPQVCDEATLYLTSIPEIVIADNDINQTYQDVPVSGQVLTNDKDIINVSSATLGGDPFVLSISKQVSGVDINGTPVTNAGSLIINADGTYTFSPAPGFVGTVDPVAYTGTGASGSTDTAILSIEVKPKLGPGNNPPLAQNDVNSTEVNVTVTSTVLNNDSDPDGDPVTVTSASIALGSAVQVAGVDTYGNPVVNAGTVTLNPNGTYTYEPATGFIGTVNDINYTINDGNGETDNAILSINVIGNNGNNIFANDDANSAPQDVNMYGNVLNNDFDPEGNTQTVTAAVANGTAITIGSATTIPGVGSLTLNANGSYTFDPLAAFTGTVVVPYTVCDNGTPQACDEATLYLTTLPPANDFCAWATTADANDWAADIWEGLDCATNTWIYSPTPPTNDRPTYIRHTVEIPDGSNIVSDSLFIQPNGRLKVCGTLEIDNQIVFEVDSTGRAGQLDNSCGSTSCTVDVRSTASIIVRKKFGKNLYPWNFVSFPFNVVEDSIFIAGTRTKALWGNIEDDVADFFMAEYDGQRRADYGISNGSNYVNVPDHLILANKGYILAGGDGIDSIDFKSAIGTDFLCGPIMVPTNINVSSTGRSYCDEGWNLVGVPYVTGYNLNNAWPYEPFFVWNGVDNYTTVMADDDFNVYPFSSFFIQDWLQAYDGLTYDIEGKTFKAVKAANKFDEISLTISNSQNSDLTRIRLKEDALVSFERKNDGIKLMSPVMSVPQIYTEAQGSCAGLACNALPLNTERVDLKVRTGKAGAYKIAIVNKEKLKDVIRVMLVDTETKAQTNLMEQSYTFDIATSTTAITSRFYVVITSQDINGTDVVIGNGIRVYTAGNKVYLTGLNGKAGVNMFDAAGKLIYQFPNVENNLPFTINVPGMYIMDINTETGNARTKLIINNK